MARIHPPTASRLVFSVGAVCAPPRGVSSTGGHYIRSRLGSARGVSSAGGRCIRSRLGSARRMSSTGGLCVRSQSWLHLTVLPQIFCRACAGLGVNAAGKDLGDVGEGCLGEMTHCIFYKGAGGISVLFTDIKR